MANIKELINALVDKAPATFRIGTVTEIDTDNDVCTVEMVNGDADRLQVQLKAIVDGESTGFIVYPKLNTMVVVGIIDGVVTHSFIAMCAEVDKVKIIATKWQFNDGNFGGLVKLLDPNNTNAGALVRINQVENKLNGLINYIGALPIPVSGSVSGPAVPANVEGFLIDPITQQSDLEDTAVVH